MGVMRDSDMLWDELVDAFANTDAEVVFFFDRDTREVFFVPADYDDEAFWEDVSRQSHRYLRIPVFDYDRERLLIHNFINSLHDLQLRGFLAGAFAGRNVFGRIEEILSFYPEEYERFSILKEKALSEVIRSWMGEHDLESFHTF